MDEVLTIDRLDPPFLAELSRAQSAVWRHRHEWKKPSRILIHGPSGRGKSTFLKILYGIDLPFQGRALTSDGAAIESTSPPDLRLRHRQANFAAVFQEFYLFEKLTGEQNLQLLPQLASGINPARWRAWAEHLLIAEILPQPVEHYSPGQRQRLAVLRACLRPFRWLLLDEPWSHLDRDNRGRVITLLEEVLSERQAGLILTHLEPEPPMPVDMIFAI